MRVILGLSVEVLSKVAILVVGSGGVYRVTVSVAGEVGGNLPS